MVTSMRTLEDADAFRRLNEQWISELFSIEPSDLLTLDNPQGIVDAGGDVLIARAEDRVVGCVALVNEGHGVFELSKMAVDTAERGQGFGRALVDAAIARARELGGHELFLGSNSSLVAAVALYESVGFRHVEPASIGLPPYTRANVFMSMSL